MASVLPLVASVLLGLAAPQAVGDTAAQGAPVVEAAQAAVPAQSSGLPQRFPEPPTMREFWPVFLAFSVAWLGIVAYTLRSGRSVGRIGDRVGRLGGPRDGRAGVDR